MTRKSDTAAWIAEIDKLLATDEMRHHKELSRIFTKARKAIESGERDALARLSNALSWYLMTNHYEAPKPVIAFAQNIVKEPHKARGKLALLQLLALSLSQMSVIICFVAIWGQLV